MKKLIFIVLPLICLMLSCNSNQQAESTAASTPEASTVDQEATAPAKAAPSKSAPANNNGLTELPNSFPQIYIDAGLPVWDKATIGKVNKIEKGNDAKYQIMLTSTEDVHDIAAYYADEMKKAGWAPTNRSAGAQNKERRTMTYKKDEQQVMMNVIAIPEQDNRVITIMFKKDLK